MVGRGRREAPPAGRRRPKAALDVVKKLLTQRLANPVELSTDLMVAQDQSAFARTVSGVVEVEWAQAQADQLLRPLGSRWLHTVAVAEEASLLAGSWPGRDGDRLVAAAYLHDVGYAPHLVITEFHALDGAVWLTGLVEPEVVALVAHHSCAWVEAEIRGLSTQLDEMPQPNLELLDALTYCDMTSGPEGQRVDVEERMDEVMRRYGPDSLVTRSIEAAGDYLRDAVARAEARAGQSQGASGPTNGVVTAACQSTIGWSWR